MKGKWATFIPTFIALMLRLYPYLYTREPFTTISWDNLYLSNMLLSGKVPLSSLLIIHPTLGSEFFSAIFSKVTSIYPISFEPLIIPAVGSVSVLIIYLMVRDFGVKVAFLSSTFLALFFGEALIDASVKNGVYGEPLFLLAIWLMMRRKSGLKDYFLLFLISLSLIPIYFYFTGFLFLIALFFTLFDRDWKKFISTSLPLLILFPHLLTIIRPIYILALGVYIAFYFLTIFLLKFNVKGYVISGLITVLVILSLFVKLPYATVFPLYFLPFAVPYIVGFYYINEKKLTYVNLFLSSLLVVLLFSVIIRTSLSFYIAYRVMDYISIPLAMLFGLGGVRTKLIPFILLILATSNFFAIFATVNLQLPYTGGTTEVYTQPEYFAVSFISSNNVLAEVSTCVKYQFLFQYFGQSVDRYTAYYYLLGRAPPPTLFLLTPYLSQGYVLNYNENLPNPIPANYEEKLSNVSLIFNDGAVQLYMG
ncbi:hypothetical protein [Saccharolobus islandicus]|uniref:Glycosyltransferase RgtA/B/C/D-like domain-containing protein n=1 Tax=Saccharolobus islandicus (strain L.D.8.5 / Lassen \|nr:hypothetical protein [Sulfolobus islandicus]ADB86788.1 hypothetical protein LD85_1108 [Sulfolobus islandicus L.D.8.5]